MDYEGPQLEILVRDTKQDNTKDIIAKLMDNVKGSHKVGIYLKDKEDGDLTAAALNAVDERGFQKVEMKDFMDRVHMTKIKPEVDNLKVAAKFVKWTFDSLVNEVEDIVDAEKQVKHSQIQKKVEGMLEKEELLGKFLKNNPDVKSTFLEYPLPVLVQSGDNFTLNKFNVQSDGNKLNAETLYINVCGKYKDMNVMASRTLLVNPEES